MTSAPLVAVTGAEGFIGSHLTEALIASGHRVRAMAQYNSFSSYGWLETLSADVLSAADALFLGLIDAIGDPPAITRLDPGTVQMVKELTIHGQRLSQRDLVLLAERLRAVYFV